MKNYRSAVRPLGTAFLVALLCFAVGAGTGTTAAPENAEKAIDVNAASQEELMTLPGIGQVMAQRIIEFRKEHGPFKRVEDLLKVKGIGEKSFQKLKPRITVGRSKK